MINNKLFVNYPMVEVSTNKKIYTGVSFDLLTPDLFKVMHDKIFLFKNKLGIQANYADIVGVLIDYDLISTPLECGGYCSTESKKIAYNSGGLKTIFHEIGHSIQADLGLDGRDKREIILSKTLIDEQQTETIAYYLYNSVLDFIPPKEFDAYFCWDHIKFLDNWYKDYKYYINDIF